MYNSRKQIYLEIEKIRKRPLITYVTTIRQGINVQMAADVIPEIIKQINLIDEKNEEVDFLILSNGGDPIVAYRIISLLREKFEKINVIVPYIAYSSATLVALGADEILMHPYGNLGPIDPQINIVENNKTISYADVIKYMEFIKDIGITNEELLQKSFNKLSEEISPTIIGVVKRSSELGITLGKKLLSTHLKDKEKIKKISETLNKKFYHHGYPLGRKESIEIGLPIVKPDEILEKLLWKLTENYMLDLKFNKIFNPEEIIFDAILRVKNNEIGKLNILETEEKIAIIESSRLECSISNSIIANYVILNDGKINKNIVIKPNCWKSK